MKGNMHNDTNAHKSTQMLKNAFGFHYNTEKQKKMFLLLSQLYTPRDGVFGLGIMNI